MIRQYFTLLHICREISSYSGAIITACFEQEPGALMIALQIRRDEIYLEFNADPIFCSASIRPNFVPARRNVRRFFKELIGLRLEKAELDRFDRIITLSFENELQLEFRFFGGANSDAILYNRGNYTANFSEKKIRPQLNKSQQPRDFSSDIEILKALAKSDFLLGEHYALEACRRAGAAPETAIGKLSEIEFKQIEEQACFIREECVDSPLFYILRKSKQSAAVFSLIPLAGFPIVEWSGASASEGVRRTIGLRRREIRFAKHQKRLREALSKELHKIKRALEMASADSTHDARSMQRREWAELLLANPKAGERVGNSIAALNWNGDLINIPLDQRYTLAENAAIMYGKARDAVKRSAYRMDRLPKYQQRIVEIEADLSAVNSAIILEDLEQVEKKYPEAEVSAVSSATEKFRKFDLAEGFTAYVGKNAKNNDELTSRFAKPNDYWFHARGVSGSHLVLRGATSNTKPPKRVIEQAAAIAAYYSQQRNGGYAPVAYAQKKYVRKPKGANPGAVVMEREEVVMVRPELPFTGEPEG